MSSIANSNTGPSPRDRSIALIRRGLTEQGLAALETDVEPPTASDLDAVGQALIAAKKPAAAVDILRRAKGLDPTSLTTREALARALDAAGEKAPAKVEADGLREIMTESPETLDRLRKLYTDLRAWDFAATVTSRLLELDPANKAARRSLIDLLFSTRQPERARYELGLLVAEPALGAQDLLFAAQRYLRLPLKTGAEDARAFAIRALEAGYTPPIMAKAIVIDALLRLENMPSARREITGLATLATTAGEFAMMAEYWIRLTDQEHALNAARQGAAHEQIKKGEAPVTGVRLAKILDACGYPAEARDLLRPIRLDKIQDPGLLKNFHEACFSAELNALALAAARRVLEIEPYDPHFLQRVTLLSMTTRVSAEPAATPAPKGLLGRLFGRRA